MNNTHTLDLSNVGRTNLYHSDEERGTIQDAILCIKVVLQHVRDEKLALMIREEELQSELERYLNANAPIKRLPDNVLCNIFEWCCQDSSSDIAFCYIPIQIIISHVCSTWRQIMLDTPTFWCCIGFSPESELEYNNKEMIKFVQVWLSRAKSLPCNFEMRSRRSIYYHDTTTVWSADWYRNIVKDLISPYKFKLLDVVFDEPHIRDFLQLADEKLCCIEDLSLRYVNLSNGEPFELHKLSALTSFTLEHVLLITRVYNIDTVPDNSSRFAGVPWHQLRHITIHKWLPALFCLRILELSSDILETCFLEVNEDSSFVLSSLSSCRKPIHCRKLREFKVHLMSNILLDSDDIIDPFLSSLMCPNLKSLSINPVRRSGRPIPGSVNLQTLLKMQGTSRMSLEELDIGDTKQKLEILPLLESFPSLRHLTLPKQINFTEEAMDELGSGSLAPFLERLIIQDPSIPLGKLLEMIKTRSNINNPKNDSNTQKHQPVPFKYIRVSCYVYTQKHVKAIEKIMESGVIFDCTINDRLLPTSTFRNLLLDN